MIYKLVICLLLISLPSRAQSEKVHDGVDEVLGTAFELLGKEFSRMAKDTNNLVYIKKLGSCERFSYEMEAPFGVGSIKRSIYGLVDGKCLCIDSMPNQIVMECRYSEQERAAVRDYFLKSLIAESQVVQIKGTFDNLIAEYFINGKSVNNPVQACFQNGSCKLIPSESPTPQHGKDTLENGGVVEWHLQTVE